MKRMALLLLFLTGLNVSFAQQDTGNRNANEINRSAVTEAFQVSPGDIKPPTVPDKVRKRYGYYPNATVKIPNENGQPWIEGKLKNSMLYTGKAFIYNVEGELLEIQLFKKGIYQGSEMLLPLNQRF